MLDQNEKFCVACQRMDAHALSWTPEEITLLPRLAMAAKEAGLRGINQ